MLHFVLNLLSKTSGIHCITFFFLKFTVIASDQAYPAPLTCATTMSFTVTAADKAPYFVPVVYNWSIPETAYNTLPQITVNGFDDDRVVRNSDSELCL